MRHKTQGFTNFMRKLDGVKEDDHFFKTEGLGSELYQRYEWLLELLRGNICWSTYLGGIDQFSYPQRSDWYNLRRRIDLHVPLDTVGVYVTDRRFYRKAVEYLREYQDSQRQTGVQANPFGELLNGDSDLVDISEDIFDDF